YETTTHASNRIVLVIPGAVELPKRISAPERERVKREIREAWAVPQTAFLILFAGRVVEEKGAHVLAAAVASSACTAEHVLIVGPPETGEKGTQYVTKVLAQAGSKSASGHFRVLGAVPDKVLDALYLASDVVAIPS